MNKLKIKLENCYGIKSLDYEFVFTNDHQAYAIYAPNGVMKTSFANTFKDLSNGDTPCDRMDASLVSTYEAITDGTGSQIKSESICVIEPYNEKIFDTSGDKVLTLLANEEIRREYLEIYDELEKEKQILIKRLKKISASSNCEDELYKTFASDGNSIFDVFENTLEDVKKSTDKYTFRYNDIFDKGGKVKDFLEQNRDLFDEYCTKYDELISHSDFFSKGPTGIFGTSEAKNLSESVKGNEYFTAGHALKVNKYGDVDTNNKFTEIVDKEISKIFNNEGLKSLFDKVEKKLNANKDLGAFKKVIENDMTLVVSLANYEKFKKDVWYSYLHQIIDAQESIVSLYRSKKGDISTIAKRANDDRSSWEDAIEEFHARFTSVPFALVVDDKSDAVLNEKVPAISFKFNGTPVDKNKLLQMLSQGEKRAFYLLNIIFEIRARMLAGQETLFIIDDIADSFDYKNKYAIVEYLNDIVKDNNFYSLVLTHNFDFYRTIASRLNISRENKLHAIKVEKKIELVQEVYQKPPFITWRECMKACRYYDKNYDTNDAKKHIIALIPFVRNLIEYSGRSGESSTALGETDYTLLTSLLHQKDKTKIITFGDLKKMYKVYINTDDFDPSIADTNNVYDEIISLAGAIDDEEFNLENKIVLAMGIRHKAEEYMFSKVTDKTPITGSQTGRLFSRFKAEFIGVSGHKDNIKALESVNIMTPENIHVNSFMYEPILDMSIVELKDLHGKVLGLS